MKSKIILILTITFFIFSSTCPVFASNDKAVVKLLNYKIETEYDSKDVTISYFSDYETNEYLAFVYSKHTGKLLESYSEKPRISLQSIQNSKSSSMRSNVQDTYWTVWSVDKYVYDTYPIAAKARISIEVLITAGQSWRQVDSYRSPSHRAINDGSYTLEDKHTSCLNTSFPTVDKIRVFASGTVTVPSNNSSNWTLEILEGLSFNISWGNPSGWVARKPYEKTVQFTVM